MITTLLTATLYMTTFQKIEGVHFKGNFLWACVIGFASLAAVPLCLAYEILRFIVLTVRTLGAHPFNKVLYPVTQVGFKKPISALATAPLRFVAKHFPEQLKFDSYEAVEKLTPYIFLLAFLSVFTLG
jgi:hypothetical protein